MITEGTYKYGIKGTCKPGFERVIKHLEKYGKLGMDKKS
jgi:hypothetical protein